MISNFQKYLKLDKQAADMRSKYGFKALNMEEYLNIQKKMDRFFATFNERQKRLLWWESIR